MVLITRATLSNTFPIFIRDVLRNYLTDPQVPARDPTEWIFKEEPEDTDFDTAIVIVRLNTDTASKINMDGTKLHTPEVSVIIDIWTRTLADRDNLVNDVKTYLLNVLSDDGTTSIVHNNLVPKKYEVSVSTPTVTKFPKLIREGLVTITYEYVDV